VAERRDIRIQNLLLDPRNYRISPQEGQPQAIHAIIEEQGDKLRRLAADIADLGLNPLDLLMAMPIDGSPNQFMVVEGNRRTAAIKCVLFPQLAEGTQLEKAFKELHKDHKDDMPQVIEDVVVVADKQEGMPWIRRRHYRGLQGIGTEDWSPTARDRADADLGKFTPAKDIREFVTANADLSPDLKAKIESEAFNSTNLERLLGTAHVRQALGLRTENKGFKSRENPEWVLKVLTEMVRIVAEGEMDGEKFTEGNISRVEQRKEVFDRIAKKHEKPDSPNDEWEVSGSYRLREPEPETEPRPEPKQPTRRPRDPQSTEARKTVIPKGFRLQGLPAGKVTDVYHELKNIPVEKFPNAAAFLLRSFVEYSLDHFIEQKPLSSGESLKAKMAAARDHLKNGTLDKHQLKPLDMAISSNHSMFSPNTLNAYVHNARFHPKPLEIKQTWNDFEHIIEILWRP
jgi:hypothetical protein